MKQTFQKRILFILFFIFILSFQTQHVHAEELSETIPTGLLQLDEHKYPVYLFVPENYVLGKTYPLIVTMPAEGEDPLENIEFWTSFAKRRTFLILGVANVWPSDVPYRMDSWFLKIKNDVVERYNIDPNRVFMIGKDGGAHYAGYLGTKYPEEFSAIAMINGAWNGKFDKLIETKHSPAEQRPFFLVFSQDQKAAYESAKQQAYRFDQAGYPIVLSQLQDGEDLSSLEFKGTLLDAMTEKSKTWRAVIDESHKTFKAKFKKGVKEFFTV